MENDSSDGGKNLPCRTADEGGTPAMKPAKKISQSFMGRKQKRPPWLGGRDGILSRRAENSATRPLNFRENISCSKKEGVIGQKEGPDMQRN